MADSDDTGGARSALVRKRTDMDLMPPPPAPKRIKRPKTVLDEDTYTDGLSKIIARDFFPGLVETESQNEYLNALDSKDEEWISSAGRRLKDVMTPGRRRSRLATPSLRGSSVQPGDTPKSFAGDTPMSVRSVSTVAGRSQKEKDAVADTNVSLGSYQAKYTSEDNESFYKLLDRQNEKRAEKHAWLWNGNKLPSNMQIKQKEVQDRLAASGQSLIDDGFQKKDRLAIQDGDDRPAAPDYWKFEAKNSLMFNPGGLDDSVESVAERAQADSRAAPKSIVYANTRLLGASVLTKEQLQQQQAGVGASGSSAVPPSPSLSAVRDAIAGKPRRNDRDSMAGSTAGSTAGSVVHGGETPRVNGYAFVDDEEPEPTPASGDREPIIKFGKADATPNPFQLQDKSKREGLHHRMVERIAQSKRTSARVGLTGRVEESPVVQYPNSPSVRGNLTPAGQRLWSKIGGARRDNAISAFNTNIRGSSENANKGSRRARLREQRKLFG